MKEFISGLEEVVARTVSLVITMLIFIAYILGNPFVVPRWQEIALFLLGFWFAYEIIGYILFMLFKFFANKQAQVLAAKTSESVEMQEPPADTLN